MRIIVYCLLLSVLACKSTNPGHSTDEKLNHLANESSPYLLQHAKNPVDWHPWGEAALQKAKDENKMLIISVGYSACHWCHVMEHESFEDTTVSKLMNDHFVAIKVDREERPDIDDVYMTACHLASGKSCGWPLNAFALPDGRPVWAGTYFPKDNWLEILNYFKKAFVEDNEKLESYASDLLNGIRENDQISFNQSDKTWSVEELNGIVNRFVDRIDLKKGGRKGAPKFPMPANYEFLMHYQYLYSHPKARKAVLKTLDEMAMGGIYDQLGGGFARYSTDADWLVPHFEKMLYDNGQLVSLYSHAYQLTQNPLYKTVVKETLTFIDRELTDKAGGFYSSLDADSEGEEGKFYVFTSSEIDEIIGDQQQADLFKVYYQIKKAGNWEHGKNILHRTMPIGDLAAKNNIDSAAAAQSIQQSRSLLFDARAKRVRPGLDDKVLTAWNGLMLSGYIDAYQAIGEPEYLQTALKNAAFLAKNMMQSDGRLNRNYKDGKSVINAFLDDYALLSKAYIELYEVTFDQQWLDKALLLTEYTIEHFYDEQSGMFFYTSKLDPALITRKMETTDNVIPGSNSSMARVLFKLGTLMNKPEYLKISEQQLQNISSQFTESQTPDFFSNWLQLYLDMIESPYEVAILGEAYQGRLVSLQENYLPNALFLGGKTEGNLELLKDKLQEGATMIYVCQNKVCKFPVSEADKALKLLRE